MHQSGMGNADRKGAVQQKSKNLWVEQTSDGGYIVEANAFLFEENKQVIILYKLDEDGQMKWETNYGLDQQEWVYEIHESKLGEYILIGYADYDVTETDIYVLKIKTLDNQTR